MKEKTYKAVKIALFVVALAIAYLFALNGRYAFAPESDRVLDKWSCSLRTFDGNGNRLK